MGPPEAALEGRWRLPFGAAGARHRGRGAGGAVPGARCRGRGAGGAAPGGQCRGLHFLFHVCLANKAEIHLSVASLNIVSEGGCFVASYNDVWVGQGPGGKERERGRARVRVRETGWAREKERAKERGR